MNTKKKATILVVDDEADTLVALSEGLQAEGFTVLEASTGESAILQAKSEIPDLILLDIRLPDIGGGVVASALHEDPATDQIPIIYLTALFSKHEEAIYGLLVGGNKTLAKPFEMPKLIAEIESSLRAAATLC